MTAVGILLSFLLGWGLIRALTPRGKTETGEDVFLSWGLGMLVASQITFYSVLTFGRLIPAVTCAMGLCGAGAIWLSLTKKPRHATCTPSTAPQIFIVGLLLFCAILFFTQALVLPYGGYDAWSLWNYRAASIFRGGDHWTGIFHNEVQGKHPWLLPFFVIWGWCFAGQENVGVPILIAVLTGIATIGLLVAALTEDIGGKKALLGGIFLFFLPFFAWHSVSQYASIIVAFNLLAVCVCLKKAVAHDDKKYVVLGAAFLGALAFSKDEGIILAAAALISFMTLLKPRGQKISPNFWLTLGIACVPLILVEIFMRSDLITRAPYITSNLYAIDPSGILEPKRWTMIGDFFWNKIILHAEFGRLRLWLPLALLGLFTPMGRFILAIMLAYSTVFLLLYLVVINDLAWRMDVTADRLVFVAMPVLVYVVFYALFLKKPRIPSNCPGTSHD